MTETSQRRIYVGHASTYHDPAIAIVEGDKIFAEAIERHTQSKRAIEAYRLWYSWRPIQAALASLGFYPIDNAQITSLSTWDLYDIEPDEMAAFTSMAEFDYLSPAPSALTAVLWSSLRLEPIFNSQLMSIFGKLPPRLTKVPARDLPSTSLVEKRLDHHLAHAANAVYTSGFDECAVMVLDGYGQRSSSTAFYHFKDNTFTPLVPDEQLVRGFKGSLGSLYACVTFLCGFNSVEGEEWKMMGLAAYGKHNPKLYNFFRDRMRVNGLSYQHALGWLDDPVWQEVSDMVGGFRSIGDDDVLRAKDLAHNFQKAFEDTVIEIAGNLAKTGVSKNLAYAGGVALNSATNGQIVPRTAFERLHVPSAPGDDGNGLGAALYEQAQSGAKWGRQEPLSPYLGSMIEPERVARIVGFGGHRFRKFDDEDSLCTEVASLLAEGKLVGWIQGRAEFGPRALGNRSILGDPRSAEMKNKLNQRVKFREKYRPVAPSILAEYAAEYFLDVQLSPYMERTLHFKDGVKNRVPAVVHKDGTGRLHTVTAESNPRFYKLLRAFHALTGVPILLNTSFNVMGKPIIHSVEDAMTVFYTTGLDVLVIDLYLFVKA